MPENSEHILPKDFLFDNNTSNLNILLNTDKSFLPKAEYVIRTFCRILGLNPTFYYYFSTEEIHIYYGEKTDQSYPLQIYHNNEAVKFFSQISIYDKDAVKFVKYADEYIPFLFSPNGSIFDYSTDKIKINKDIISSAFYFLTCWQEYAEDKIIIPGDRYDYRNSLQYYWDFTDLPVVDRYCKMFEISLSQVLKKFSKIRNWPNKSLFALTISHDIDYWDYWSKDFFRKTINYNLHRLKKSPLKSLYKIIGHFLTKGIFHSTKRPIKKMIEIEKIFNSRSSFFLLTDGNSLDKRQLYFNNKETVSEIKSLLTGQDVGLHGNQIAAFDKDTLAEQKSAFEKEFDNCFGYRNHHLSFDYQKSFALLEEAGFKYDSTLGFWENIGFRAGISYPFFPFNINQNRPFRVLEIPLIIMDTTLFSAKSMSLSTRKSKHKIKKMILSTRKNKSHLSILWHNNMFDPVDYPGWGKLYYKTLRYAFKNDAWICSLKDLYSFWMEN